VKAKPVAPETTLIRNSKVLVPVLAVGDTYLVENILLPDLAEVAFENLRKYGRVECHA
jgi:hypothetical protein